MIRIPSLSLSLALLGLLASGCNTSRTVAPQATAPPATSATGAVKRLEFAFNHRDVDTIAGVLADNTLFMTTQADSVGSLAEVLWTRARLLAALQGILVGDPPRTPEAVRVSLAFDRELSDMPDDRFGGSSEVHRAVRTSFEVVVSPDGVSVFEARGYLLFFVTRGDSALIPADLRARGATATATRWWIERVEDETLPSGGYHTSPASAAWFGRILSHYDAWIGAAFHSPSADLRRRS